MSCGDGCSITEMEKESIKQWIADYDEWKASQENYDWVTQNRHRTASSALSQLIIGLPLYLYHWRLAEKKRKEEEEV